MSRDEDSKSARTRTNALKNTSNREENKFFNHFFLILHFFPRRNLPFQGKITHAKFHHRRFRRYPCGQTDTQNYLNCIIKKGKLTFFEFQMMIYSRFVFGNVSNSSGNGNYL